MQANINQPYSLEEPKDEGKCIENVFCIYLVTVVSHPWVDSQQPKRGVNSVGTTLKITINNPFYYNLSDADKQDTEKTTLEFQWRRPKPKHRTPGIEPRDHI